jgi:hypothetical protein
VSCWTVRIPARADDQTRQAGWSTRSPWSRAALTPYGEDADAGPLESDRLESPDWEPATAAPPPPVCTDAIPDLAEVGRGG